MVATGNKIYAIGGFNSELEEGARVQNSIEEYELDSGTVEQNDLFFICQAFLMWMIKFH
jgi:hypothetical protein